MSEPLLPESEEVRRQHYLEILAEHGAAVAALAGLPPRLLKNSHDIDPDELDQWLDRRR